MNCEHIVASTRYCTELGGRCIEDKNCFMYTEGKLDNCYNNKKEDSTEKPKYCKYCFNARVWEPTDEEIFNSHFTYLTDENDGSACGVGTRTNEHDIMICSGMGKPVRIEFR